MILLDILASLNVYGTPTPKPSAFSWIQLVELYGAWTQSREPRCEQPNIQSFFVLAGKGQCGVLLFQENPVDPSMNEHYLWHGCKPEGAEGITDANFDLKRDSVRSLAVP